MKKITRKNLFGFVLLSAAVFVPLFIYMQRVEEARQKYMAVCDYEAIAIGRSISNYNEQEIAEGKLKDIQCESARAKAKTILGP